MDRRPNTIDYLEFGARNAGDHARSKAFFGEVFGWTWQDYGPDYSDTQSSGIGAGINADSDHRTPQPLPVIYVEDLEAAQSRVVAAGGIVTRAIFAFPGGRRFHFAEPSGNEFGVWSER